MAKTGFSNGFANIPTQKYYKYHGLVRECNIEPILPPYLEFPTSKEKHYIKIYVSESRFSVYKRDDVYNIAHNALAASGDTKHYGQYYFPPGLEDYSIQRGAHLLDARILPPGAEIIEATYNFEVDLDQTDVDFDLVIQSLNAAPYPFSLSTYNKAYFSGDGGSKNTAGMSGIVTIDLNEVGISWISLTEITKIGVRSSRDILGIQPAGLEFFSYKGTPYFNLVYTL